jgi:hypothetical protein
MQQMVDIERRKLFEVAREYRKRGYDVIVEPRKEQLPGFLTPFQPDILARNSQEAVIIEIKSRHSLSRSPDMEALAATIQQHEGWRFELVVTNSKGAHESGQNLDDLLAKSDIRARLEEAKVLLHQEHGEAAFLITWSAAEAGLRRLLIQEGLVAEYASASILKHLFVHGLLDQQHYDTLRKGLEMQNTLMHGYKDTEITIDFVNNLMASVEQLL